MPGSYTGRSSYTDQKRWVYPKITPVTSTGALSGKGSYSDAVCAVNDQGIVLLPWADTDPGAGGPARFVIGELDPNANVALQFWGTDANDETGSARVWGVTFTDGIPSGAGLRGGQIVDATADYLLDLALVLGNQAFAGGIITTANAFWADTITVNEDATLGPTSGAGGARVTTGVAEVRQTLVFDDVGYPYLIVELTRASKTAAGLGLRYRQF
jgi:hypothetical protein